MNQARLSNMVKHLTSLTRAGQKTAVLKQTQMLRGHIAGNLTGMSKPTNRTGFPKQDLNHPKPMRM
ncbi:MAG: hypothetical protein A2520_04540 [Deltaproteobacteria bacterium RIFOXYD12_FULL_53_23]|nr:MAG: hypothetical protein A2520_04540 [Deltaproteobacteria bacterium RIFOXYD12_FULL_53_23]